MRSLKPLSQKSTDFMFRSLNTPPPQRAVEPWSLSLLGAEATPTHLPAMALDCGMNPDPSSKTQLSKARQLDSRQFQLVVYVDLIPQLLEPQET